MLKNVKNYYADYQYTTLFNSILKTNSFVVIGFLPILGNY